jgi:hypothetical protein
VSTINQTYLSTTVTRKLVYERVVPETLERSLNGSLVFVVAVGVGRTDESGGSSEILHDCGLKRSITFCTARNGLQQDSITI